MNYWIHPRSSHLFKQKKMTTIEYYHIVLPSYEKNIITEGGLIIESFPVKSTDEAQYFKRLYDGKKMFEKTYHKSKQQKRIL
ncbi:MAG: hypothetical protein EBQ92_13315 [Proteobacteria bacterium]|nr:hypothetical protein [Pseudomonadota bacterium]